MVDLHLQGCCPSLESIKAWDGMPVLHSGDIAAEKPGALFDVALGEVFCGTKFQEPFADIHGMFLHFAKVGAKSMADLYWSNSLPRLPCRLPRPARLRIRRRQRNLEVHQLAAVT